MRTRELPREAVVAIVVAANLAVLALGWFVVVAPQRHDAARTADAVNATQAQIDRLQSASASPAPAPTQPAIRTADLYRLAQAMPSTTDMPDLLLEVDQVAREAGVAVLSISPGTPTAATSYTVVPISLTFTGDFYSLTDLLYRLRALVTVRHGDLDASGRLFSIVSVALAPTSGGKTLSATVSVDAYAYGTAAATGAAGATTTPAATTGTTTGTTTTNTTTTSAGGA